MQDKNTKLKQLEKKLSNSFQEESNSWVRIGIGFNKISQLIDPSSDQSAEWKKVTGFPSFSKYVENKWGYKNPQKGIKQRIAAKNLLEHKPELLEDYKSKRHTRIPGFSVIYQLETIKDSVDEETWKSLIEKVYSDKLTRKDLEEMVPKQKPIKSKSSPSQEEESSTQKDDNPRFHYSDDSLNDKDSRNEYFDREAILLKDIPNIKNKVETLFPGEQGDRLRELINLLQDELKSIMYKAKAA